MTARILIVATMLWAAGAVSAQSAAGSSPVRLAGLVTAAAVDEISGLAASRQHPGILWVHNDSGNPAELYALDESAELRATLQIEGARNIDWEDLALFEDGGRHWLLIADTGDNGGLRHEAQLHFVAEPESIADGTSVAARTLRFSWPNGARDCEAMAVDVGERAIYLISKKRVPPELYRLPLDADSSAGPVVAERVGQLQHISQPSARDLARNPVYGRYRAQITAMDISRDGRQMAVLNYLQARIYARRQGESWTEAIARKPRDLPFPWTAQAEAIGFAADGRSLWLGSEILPAPLLQILLRSD